MAPKSANLEGITDVLGIKKEAPRDRPIERLDPVPGKEPAQPVQPAQPPAAPVEPAPADKHDDGDTFVMPPPSAPDELFDPPVQPAQPAPVEDGVTDADLAKWEPKQAETFKNMRLELKAAREALKNKGANQPSPEMEHRLTEAQKALAEAHETIARLNLSEDPRFKAKYEAQTGFLVNAIKEQAKALDIDDGLVDVLAKLPLKDRLAMINRQAPALKEIALPLFTQLDMLNNQRANELANASKNKDQFSAQRSAEINALQSKVITDTVKAAQAKGHFVFKKIEGNVEWNAAVDNSIATAEQIIRSGNIAQQAEAITLGAVAPMYLAMYNAERQARKTLAAQLAKYIKSGPTIRNPDGTGAPAKDMPKTMSADEASRRIASRSKAQLL